MLKNLLFLAGFSLFVVVVFIVANLYMETTDTTISPTTQKNLEPIEDSFNVEILEKLKERIEVPVDLASQANIIATQTNNNSTSRSAQISPTATPKPNSAL